MLAGAVILYTSNELGALFVAIVCANDEMTEAELERIAAGDPPSPGVCRPFEIH